MFGELNPRLGGRSQIGRTLVYRATNLAASAGVSISFDAVDVDSDGLWVPGLSAAVIKRAGVYFVGAYIRNGSTPTQTDVRVWVNGATYANGAAVGTLYNFVTCMTALSVGDQVSVALSNAITISAAAKLSRMEICGPF